MKRLAMLAVMAVLSAAAGLEWQSRAAAQDGDGWGTIKGRIVWGDKDLPKRKPVEAVKDKTHCLSKGDILDEVWVVSEKNKGLRWTFVWLAPNPKGEKKDLPIHPDLRKVQGEVVIDQPVCMFTPHAVGIREGQTLMVKNPAPISHSFKYTGDPDVNPGGNTTMPANSEIKITKLKADRMPVKMECALHPWMNGWIRVFNHPYFAVTDENGAFEIKNAPAGEFRLFVWHGSGGWLGGADGRNGRPIAVEAGKTKDLGSMEYSPPK